MPLLLLATLATAEWQVEQVEKRKVLDVTFESSKDYDITSAYAVRGWNTTEGKMRMIAPSAVAKHGGRFGLEVRIEKAYTKNFHAQFSLPHFMPRTAHSAYQLTYWAKQLGSGDITPEVSILDVDEGYDWVGGAEIELGTEWQHIAMEPVYTNENQRGHELQIAFMIGAKEGTVCFEPNPNPQRLTLTPTPQPINLTLPLPLTRASIPFLSRPRCASTTSSCTSWTCPRRRLPRRRRRPAFCCGWTERPDREACRRSCARVSRAP